MLVYSWIVIGVACGAAAHYYLGKERGYDLFGEVLVGISAAGASGTVAPIILGVRTGSVDILSDVGLLTAFLGGAIGVTVLAWLTPRAVK